jgi:hypothetical protein
VAEAEDVKSGGARFRLRFPGVDSAA